MAHIVTKPCNNCKYTDCVVVCPVECFYSSDTETMLYINPDECIDCEACVPECPVEAIFADHSVPEEWQEYIEINREKTTSGSLSNVTEKQSPLGPPV